MKKFCILFAGPMGSGKSPIANYLSYKLDIPRFNNDEIRTEVREDLLRWDKDEYLERRDKRVKELLLSEVSYIYDASIDRRWKDDRSDFIDLNYVFFIISLDFSLEKLMEIYEAKNYTAIDGLKRSFEEHRLFLDQFGNDVGVHIDDSQFHDRLEVAYEACVKNDLHRC